MSDNIKKLGIVKKGPEIRSPMDAEDKAAVIDYLHELLEQVENDEITALCVVAPRSSDKEIEIFHRGTHQDRFRCLGALDIVSADITTRVLAEIWDEE